MALGPQKQHKEALLKQVEEIVDEHVKDCSSECLTLATSLFPGGLLPSDWKVLEKKYKKAGWKSAEYVSDQRDGDYIHLKS